MQIVIEIDEEAKQAFDCARSNDLKGCYYDHGGIIGNAIKNGTPLPEHHGRLIDADALEQEMIIAEGKAEGGCNYYMADVIDRAKEYIIDAETIIPATKEGDGE